MRHTTKDVVLMTALSVAIVGMLAGCQRQAPADNTAAAPPATAGTVDNAPPPAPAYQPPTAEQLYALVSPIALFPDKLVALTLAASTHPDDVHAARGFLEDNRNLSGSALIDAASNQPWDPSVKALVAFPAVVDQLDGHNDWTAALGAAYAAEPTDVLNAIQVMRQRARAHGSLADTPQQKIRVVETPQPTTTTVVEERRVVEPPAQTIEIEPAEPDVVYVPRYDPDVVYGEPVYSRVYTTERWYEPAPDRGDLVATGLVSFGVGVVVGELFAHHHDHPWGWNAWNTSWGGPRGGGYGPPAVVYDNHPYVVNRNTVINRYTSIDRSVHVDNRHNFGNVSVHNTTYNGAPPAGPMGRPAPAAMAPHPVDFAHMQRPNFNPAMMRATAPNARPALPPPGAERAAMMPRPAGEPGRPVDPRAFAAGRPMPNAPHGVDPATMQRNEHATTTAPGAPHAPERPVNAEAFARDRQALAAHAPQPMEARPPQTMDARHAPAPPPTQPRQEPAAPRMPPNDAARFAPHAPVAEPHMPSNDAARFAQRAPAAEPRMESQRMDQRMPPREEPRMQARPEPRPEPRMEARPAPRPEARPESRPAPRHDDHRPPEHKDDKHDH